jgi:hypothetical protein
MSDRWNRWPAPFVAALALAASLTSIVNQFTYDDKYIVEHNPVMRTLHGWWHVFQNSYWPREWGGDGYRPLTILAIKIEWMLGGGQPALFHGVNIALYAIVSVLVLAIAKRMMPLWAATLCAALFAVHPVHVEAVANIVGQSELLVASFTLGAVLLYLRDRQRGALRTTTILQIAVLYAAACFSKEHGIVLPALLLACELTIISDEKTLLARVLDQRWLYMLLVGVAVSFVAIRSVVLADHGLAGFQPFMPFAMLRSTRLDRVLTAIGVVPQWVRLLYWPAHLSPEYGPADIQIAQGFSIGQLPGLIILLAVLCVGWLARRKQPLLSLGIAFMCITLLPSSNFVLPAGIVVAERTLFLPSVGAMLVVGAIAVYAASVVERRKAPPIVLQIGFVAITALLVVATVRSANRARVWHDDETLFRQAIIDSPNAYRAHYMLGGWAFDHQRQREGERELRRALNLFPYDPFVAYNMAEQYRESNQCKAAVPMYQWALSMDKSFGFGRTGLSVCLLETGKYSEAKATAEAALKAGVEAPQTFREDSVALGKVVALADSVLSAHAATNVSGPVGVLRGPSKVPESMQKTAEKPGVPKGL